MTLISTAAKHSLAQPISRNVWIVLTLFMAAVVTRFPFIGDPTVSVDEQFYLLVADQMWHGALPYVDIWDRKPILLFLIYAALRPFSADGIIAYQIGALLFAVATAFVVVLIAQRFASLRGAWLAGLAYLLYLPLLSGAGGQSPVFYNLFLALGAWEVIRAAEASDTDAIGKHGMRSMLWAGLAIQVKYTAAIDGIAFGLWLIALLLSRKDRRILDIAARAILWVIVALAPTCLAASVYAFMGHGQEFFQANFLSIFQKHEPAGFSSGVFFIETAIKLVPLILVTTFSLLLLIRNRSTGGPVGFLLLWFGFGAVDFFAIGNYFDHYALPLLLPAVVICAPLLDLPVAGAAAMACFSYFSILAAWFQPNVSRELDESRVAGLVKAAEPYAARGCIYLHDGPTIVYGITHSCLPTRYVFPGHLGDANEAQATDATHSMKELLATRPSAIFVADRRILEPPNLEATALLQAALAQDYERMATLPDVILARNQILYVRKDLLPPAGRPLSPNP